MRTTIAAMAAVLLFAAVSPSHAFDGQRKGFLFGAGFGIGSTRISSQNMYGNASIWRSAPALSFRIGFAPNNHTGIFIGAKSVLTYMDEIERRYSEYGDAMESDGFKGAFAIMGAPFVLPILWLGGAHSTFGLMGFTHYFTDRAPGYFVEGTVGVGIVPDEFRHETFGGFGLSVAGGYEFKPHLSLRLDLIAGWGEDSVGDGMFYGYKEKSSAISFMLTLNLLAY